MKALVTGAAGFIGSTLSRRLLDEGYDVLGIDSLTDYYDVALKQSNLAQLENERFQFVHGDLNFIDPDAAIADVDVIFHQAGQPGVRRSWGDNFSHYLQSNISATQRLLEAAKRSERLTRFVYASSSSVYGDAERYPTLESDVPRPRSPYGVSKLAAEHLCVLYAHSFGVPAVALRYFTVFGPRQRPDMAFTRFIRAAIADEDIIVYGDGRQIRDFTYVDDIVNANLRAATSDTLVGGTVLNVAGGTNVSVNDVLDVLSRLLGRSVRVRRQSAVAGDIFRTGGSTDAIKAVLGWEPQTTLEEGLSRQLDWAARTLV